MFLQYFCYIIICLFNILSYLLFPVPSILEHFSTFYSHCLLSHHEYYAFSFPPLVIFSVPLSLDFSKLQPQKLDFKLKPIISMLASTYERKHVTLVFVIQYKFSNSRYFLTNFMISVFLQLHKIPLYTCTSFLQPYIS